MAKYRKKPIIVDAEPYREGLEDGWLQYYSGNMFEYEKYFNTKEECVKFAENDLGKLECSDEDKNYNIIYEDPVPYIKALNGIVTIKPSDMIITAMKGKKHSCKKDIFEKTYERVEE